MNLTDVFDFLLFSRYPVLTIIPWLSALVWLLHRSQMVAFAVENCPSWKILQRHRYILFASQLILSISIVGDVCAWLVSPSDRLLLYYALFSVFLISVLRPSDAFLTRMYMLRAQAESPTVERRL